MKKNTPQLLISDTKGKIYNVPYLEASGMKAGRFFRLSPDELVRLPASSEIFMLPERYPVGYDPQSGGFGAYHENPLKNKREKCFAVAAFLPPGFTITYNSAYQESGRPPLLPLFAYGAAVFYKGAFYVAALRVDKDCRNELRYIDINIVRKNAMAFKKLLPRNRLVRHLEDCALVYACSCAKNFFLKRYEAPLPVSPFCNADCFGCISFQPAKRCPVTQPRIKFVPTPEEVSEAALLHIGSVRDPIVSFGQGCEGEPLLKAGVLENAIKLIRKRTKKGIINLNTNASIPEAVARLFDCGLDTMRVSLNSAREAYYARYYKPKGYRFKDVLQSIKIAKRKKGFVSINYLTMPGFTDLKDEYLALKGFIDRHGIDMIQWRNLNFDPMAYFRGLKVMPDISSMLGVKEAIKSLERAFPHLMTGYFNPSRAAITRHYRKA